MRYTFRCGQCGELVTRDNQRPSGKVSFCCCSCAAKWRITHGKYPVGFTMDNRGALPHEMVNIRVKKDLDLFPGFRPDVGKVYQAERYQGQGGSKLVGYVISVNGHRVNVRQNECVEV